MTGYNDDFALWAKRQAQLLKERRFHELDLENLVEEVGNGIPFHLKQEIEWHLRILLVHLLKWHCFEGWRPATWSDLISEHRVWIDSTLDDAPSMKPDIPELVHHLWSGVTLAVHKTMGINFDLLPAKCPWTVDEVLSVGFLPK